ncbi:MAG: hypothetical protein U0T77_08010 [Chitinophagales bacterium]
MSGCKSSGTSEQAGASSEGAATEAVGQSGVQDEVSNPNIVQVAAGSKDHTTLVAAVKAAGLWMHSAMQVRLRASNAAFDKLPKVR